MKIEILKDFTSTQIGSRAKGEIIEECPDYYAGKLIEEGLAQKLMPKQKATKNKKAVIE